jgi:hypothetical protein
MKHAGVDFEKGPRRLIGLTLEVFTPAISGTLVIEYTGITQARIDAGE